MAGLFFIHSSVCPNGKIAYLPSIQGADRFLAHPSTLSTEDLSWTPTYLFLQIRQTLVLLHFPQVFDFVFLLV